MKQMQKFCIDRDISVNVRSKDKIKDEISNAYALVSVMQKEPMKKSRKRIPFTPHAML